MIIKNIKKEAKNASYNTIDVYDKIKDDIYTVNYKKKEKASFKLSYAFLPAFTFLLIAISLIIIKPYDNSFNKNLEKNIEYNESSLYKGLFTVNSKDNLQRIINKSVPQISQTKKNELSLFDSFNSNKYGDSKAPIEEEAHSKTNTQVEGVDEADVVKYDGNYIYKMVNNSLYVYKLDKENTKTVFKETLANLIDVNLYLHNNYLILIANTSVNEGSFTSIYIYNKNELSNGISKKDEYLIEGVLSSSRLIEARNELHIVSEKYIASNLKNVEEPKIIVKGKENKTSYNNIYYSKDSFNSSFVTISSFKLEENISMAHLTTLGNVINSTIYSTDKSLYLVSLSSDYNHSVILKYTYLENGEIGYRGSYLLEGSVKDNYSLDEKDNYLRVVSSYFSVHKLSILKEDLIEGEYVLSLVSSINEGIGKKNEQIKSVLFKDNKCFIVTFRNTDPLYTIDLSNVLNPVITSSYETPGYSSYLYKIPSTSFALGLGYTSDNQYKLSLYLVEGENGEDITQEVAIEKFLSSYYSNNYYYNFDIESLSNPKAIYTFEDNDYFYFGFGKVASGKFTQQQNTILNKYYLFKFNKTELESLKPTILEKIDLVNEYNNKNNTSLEVSTYLSYIKDNSPFHYEMDSEIFEIEINETSNIIYQYLRLCHNNSDDYYYITSFDSLHVYLLNEDKKLVLTLTD